MKEILFVLLLLTSLSLHAELVTSPYAGVCVDYLPDAGQVVEKGSPLIKFDDRFKKIQIKIAELSLKEAEEMLKDKKTDIERARTLHKRKAISKASLEDVIYEYQITLLNIEKLRLEIDEMKMDLKDYVMRAPFECKVIKRIVCKGSGTQYGTKLLEIEKL
ncbi:MAG TPA: hypothetical protein QF753_01335 [Victivallales bacterium]|nr:hypothetical protein [Victivallales bacterium]